MENNAKNKRLSREYLEQQIMGARGTLLAVLLFTLVNLVLLLTDSGTYFLFSASGPYYMTLKGLVNDIIAAMSETVVIGSNTITALVVSALILGAYFLCWLLSKKKTGWLTVAQVMFVLDTLVLLYVSFGVLDNGGENIIDILFHGLVIYQLAQGISCGKKLKKLPVEVPEGYQGTTPELDG